MPELVDVEGFRRVAARAADRAIREVRVHDAGVLRGVAPGELADALCGRAFGRPSRHGKWLMLPLTGTDAELMVHFGMTGSLHWYRDARLEELHPHDRVEFVARGGVLRYRDMRKLTGLHLAPDATARRGLLRRLGPDALSVGADELRELLGGGRERPLKSALMDQALIAGLGNLLVDEILWTARLHPRRPTTSLGSAETEALARDMHNVLRAGVRAGRVPPRSGWLTGHRDEPDGRCPRDAATLRRGRVGGRTTVWCPECQPEHR